MSCWFNTTYSGTQYDQVIIRRDGDSGTSSNRGLVTIDFNKTAGTANKAQMQIWNGTASATITSISSVNTGNWVNIVGIRESGVIKLYINGSLESSISANIAVTNTNQYFGVGHGLEGVAFLNGKVDEVIVENTAWSAEKVKKYYTFTKARFGII